MAGDRPPEPVLHGRLTFLRVAERDDVPTMVRWFNDYRTTRFISTRAPMSEALEERWFERMIERQGTTDWHFVICRLDDERPLGTIGLFQVDLTNGNAGIGISIGDEADRGRGFGTDAMEVLLDFGFARLRLERLWLDLYDFNDRAKAVYERLGFVHEGMARHGAFRDGRFVDVLGMAILRDEWAERRAADPFPGRWPPD